MITPHASPAAGSSPPLPELPIEPGAPDGGAARPVPSQVPPLVASARGASPKATVTPAAARKASPSKTSSTSSTRSSSTRRSTGAGYAPKATSSRTGSSKTGGSKTTASKSKAASAKDGPLAFLSDPKLTVEEKLFRLCLYAADKYDKALEKKMKELQSSAGGSGATKAGASTGTKKKSGVLGVLAKAVKTVAAPALELLQVKEVQAVAKVVAGPVLAAGATALGFPQVAPALLKAGPQLVTAAKDLSKELDQLAGSSSSGARSAATGSASSSGSDLPQIDQKQMMELQYLSEKQREMFGMVSNLLGSMHQTRMAIINNLRA